MKKTLLFTLMVAAASVAFAEVKVATLDMAKIFDNYNRAKTAQNNIEAEMERLGKEAQRRQNEGRDLSTQLLELQKKYNNEALSKDARESAKKQARDVEDKLEAKSADFQKFQMESRKMISEKQDNQRLKIYGEIQNAAITVARKQGASLILNISDKTAAGLPVVIYSDKTWDITDKVISTLNAGK
jgi:outer membrane protein